MHFNVKQDAYHITESQFTTITIIVKYYQNFQRTNGKNIIIIDYY